MFWKRLSNVNATRTLVHHRHPARTLAFGFAVAILAGGLLLQLPACTRVPVGPSAAFFTATSAICVTGLTVVDTPATFTPLGQALILLMIQAGGLGYMTGATFLALVLRRQPSLHDRLILSDSLAQLTLRDTGRLVRTAVGFTLLVETVGAVLLTLRFAQDPGRSVPQALWLGVANSISAFCNADFGWLGVPGAPGTLGPYRSDMVVNLTIAALTIIGGLGFGVCQELLHRKRRPLSLQSRIVISVSGIMLAVGMLALLMIERTNSAVLGQLSLPEKVLVAFFHSAAIRTAGFSTVDFVALHPTTLLVLALLMFIGASPGGTGGGVKSTTVAVTLAAVWASLRGQPEAELFNRRIPQDLVYRALVLIFLSASVILVGTLALAVTEAGVLFGPGPGVLSGPEALARIQFEAVSAFATAGISAGVTPGLTEAGRIVVMVLMFVGRLGPVTLAMSWIGPTGRVLRQLPEERIPLG